jgi:hypothetical protein
MSSAGIYGLVSGMAAATKIVEMAKSHHLAVRIFDRSTSLIENAKISRPCLVILDCDEREAQAFEVLKAFSADADLSRVAIVGYLSQAKAALKPEIERAGCLRGYLKTEFMRELPNIILRYAK